MSVRGLLVPTLSVLAFIGIWELIVRLGLVDPFIVSSPMLVAQAAGEVVGDPGFAHHVATSAYEFGMGFFAAAVSGVVLGLLAGWYRRFGYMVDPIASALFVTPRVALIPLFVLWFGLGSPSTIAVVFLGGFITIFITTMAGVRTLDASLIRMARTFMASDWMVFRTIVLPGTAPFVITGTRLGVGLSLIGVILGELYAASAGLGYYIHVTASSLQIDKMFVAILFIAIVGLLLNGLLTIAQGRIDHWLPETHSI